MEVERIINELRLALYELKNNTILQGAIRAIEHAIELLNERIQETLP